MINTMVSEIFEIVLPFILGFAYSYLTISILIFIIFPIIILIGSLSLSMPNKTKICILLLNTIYSFFIIYSLPSLSTLPIIIIYSLPPLPIIYSLLLLILSSLILNYGIILNNMFLNNIYVNIYLTSLFLIFDLILAEIYRNIESFVIIYVITIIISTIIILFYVFRKIYHTFKKYKEYIYVNKNKKFFIVALPISLVAGSLLLWLISTINSIKPIHVFFLCTLLTAVITSYSSTKKININILKDLFEVLVALSFLLGLAFLSAKESIVFILKSYPMLYELILYFITSLIIFFVMFTVYVYIYVVEETYKNIIKWYVLTGYSFMNLPVYFTAKGAILYTIGEPTWYYYTIVGLSILALFLCILFHFHSNVIKNINKKISNDFWDALLFIYAIPSFAISFVVEESLFYMAIGYAIFSIISLLIAIKLINKNKDVMNGNLMSKNY